MKQHWSGRRVFGIRLSLAIVIFTMVAVMFSGLAQAEESENSDGWRIVITPYLWAISLNGKVTVKGQKADVDVSFGDILENLNIAAMANVEVSKGRWGMFVNPLYAQLEDDVSSNGTNADVTTNMFIMDFGLYYRLGPYALSSTPGALCPSVTVKPYIGGRYTNLNGDLNVKGDGLPSYDGSQGWADPIIGVNTQWNIDRRWNVLFGGNIGGFGVSSRFAWSALGLVGYRFNFSKSVAGNVLLGYRALYQDYDTGSGSNKFEWDTYMHGPLAGLAIGF